MLKSTCNLSKVNWGWPLRDIGTFLKFLPEVQRNINLTQIGLRWYVNLFYLIIDPTPEAGMAVEMLGGVLQESIPHVMVLDGIQGNGLKPPPPKGDNQWIATFQNLLVPSVFLNSSLSKTKPKCTCMAKVVHVLQ